MLVTVGWIWKLITKKKRNELREDLASLQVGMKESRDNLEIQRFIGLEEAIVSSTSKI